MSYESYFTSWTQRYPYWTGDLHAGVAVVCCSLIVTILLLYGICRHKPGYLMPFFCLQVFDLTLTLLTILGYFSYMPNFRNYLRQSMSSEQQEAALDNTSNEYLLVLCLLFATSIVTIKAYLISVIWSCYKFLCHRNALRQSRQGLGGGGGPDTEQEQLILPPSYETIIKLEDEGEKQAEARPAASGGDGRMMMSKPPAYTDICRET